MPEYGISDIPNSEDDTAESHVNFVEALAEERAQEYAAREAAINTADALQHLNDRIEAEIHAREYADKKAVRRELAAITIGLLTLIATILFGILALLH